ncbi:MULTISPECIES: DUF3107 domain-containing protein [Kocuria]|uniref:DUF3107 domain-containing protein n=1 Tax=Kocuria TaxID=57493 RepID=UPI000660A34F|nr:MULTISPECIES: DUF3107 domain-containing protein [Kocuria]MCT1367508.1 DUF3107 domain-containing protein [Rothia sp. p3-SID1597]RUQ22307.1 DUF3107 domain-containing protein [Kocuria sp. HSID16901]
MEIKIGVKDVAREVAVESDESPEEIRKQVAEAIDQGTLLRLADSKGNVTLVPGASIGYVEIAAETRRHIGFGPFSEN